MRAQTIKSFGSNLRSPRGRVLWQKMASGRNNNAGARWVPMHMHQPSPNIGTNDRRFYNGKAFVLLPCLVCEQGRPGSEPFAQQYRQLQELLEDDESQKGTTHAHRTGTRQTQTITKSCGIISFELRVCVCVVHATLSTTFLGNRKVGPSGLDAATKA